MASENPAVEGYVRGLIRARIGNPDASIPECRSEECDVSFLGMTAEDYAVHLVEEHSYYREGLVLGDERSILEAVATAMIENKNRSVDTGTEHGGES